MMVALGAVIAVFVVAAVVYAALRGEPSNVRSARQLGRATEVPRAMQRFAEGTDQQAFNRDFLVDANDIRTVATAVRPPPGFAAGPNNQGRQAVGWTVVGTWNGPDPRRQQKRCVLTLEWTSEIPAGGRSMSVQDERNVESGTSVFARLSALCER